MSDAQQQLATLRESGAWRIDPARFHALEALARRLPQQPEAVRHLLRARLEAGVADYASRIPQAPAADLRVPRRPAAKPPATPLAQLNAQLRTTRAPQDDELASVRRFRQAWAGQRTLAQVERAAARKPAHAGPLNSHVLVLQSLELMRELSPDYLRHFLAQVETLQWLELAAEKYPRPQARSAKPGKATKAASRRNLRRR